MVEYVLLVAAVHDSGSAYLSLQINQVNSLTEAASNVQASAALVNGRSIILMVINPS